MKIVEDGIALDASFALERTKEHLALTLESRSGMLGAPATRNADYNRGLEILLERLKAIPAIVERISLDPHDREEGSTLALEGFGYPLKMDEVPQIHRLRLALAYSQMATDRRTDTQASGEQSPRLRFCLATAPGLDEDVLVQQLTGEAPSRRPPRALVWAQLKRLAAAGLGRAVVVSHQRDKFLLDVRHPGARLLTTRPDANGFIRADEDSLLFRDPSAALVAAVPAGLRAASSRKRRLEIPWSALAEADVAELFRRVLAVADLPEGGAEPGMALPAPPKSAVRRAGELLAEAEAAHARGARRWQGVALSSAERRAVDRRAMEVAAEGWAGWSVEDVSATECYDLRCRKDGVEVHVEVRGTTGSGEAVTLTRAEVDHARDYPNVVLVIVSGIVLQGGAEPTASGGQPRVLEHWEIEKGSLEPLAYRFSPPPRKP